MAKKKTEMTEEVRKILGIPVKVKGVKVPRPKYVPWEEPIAELKELVLQHKALVRSAQSLRGQNSDRTSLFEKVGRNGEILMRKGDVIPCRIPGDVAEAGLRLADFYQDRAKLLESMMSKNLRSIPVYTEFLDKVFGCGPVVAAYLITNIDFERAVKPSNLRRFCGMAVIDGKLERRTKGAKNAYNSELRMRLYQMFGAMWKNAAKVSVDAPAGKTCKYLTIWTDYKHRMAHSARVVEGKIVNGAGKTVSAKGFAHSTGWHKACDVFLEDLYIVGRTLAGLEVWPTYQTAKLGYGHGAKVSDGSPRLYTLEEALGIVGNVGGVPRSVPIEDMGEEDMGDVESAAE